MNHRAASVVVDVEKLHLELIGLAERKRRVHLQAAATVENTLDRVLEPFDAARLQREDPLGEQMGRDLAPIPSGIAADVPDVVPHQIGGPRRNSRQHDGARDLRRRLVGLSGRALRGDERGASKGAEHRPLMEDVTRRYRHIDSPGLPVRWSACRPTRLSTIW